MFWPVVFPAEITCGILAGVILLWLYTAPRSKKGRGSVVIGLVGILLCIPSCTGIMLITDIFRFGEFQYPEYRSINDSHVQSSLPEAATDITVEKSPHGNLAKYTIAREDIRTWHEQFWKAHSSTIARDQIDVRDQVIPETFNRSFSHLNWSLPADAECYHGPVSERGGGYSIWYSPSQRTAYQRTAYW